MKTSSTLNILLAAATAATLAVAAPDANAETQYKSSSMKHKEGSGAEVASDTKSGNRSITKGTTHQDSRATANSGSQKSMASSLKFWDRDKDKTSASRSDDNHRWSSNAKRDESHRSVMMKRHDQKMEEKKKPSIWDRLMFWNHNDRS